MILLLLLVCSTTDKSATYAMNRNETAIAGGRRTVQPRVYQKMNPQTRTCMYVGCQEDSAAKDLCLMTPQHYTHYKVASFEENFEHVCVCIGEARGGSVESVK